MKYLILLQRTRVCDSPLPQYGGADCTDSNTEVLNCTLPNCPIGEPRKQLYPNPSVNMIPERAKFSKERGGEKKT
jgi:hypothetical protein